jgi:N-acetylglucosaminyl-diphospho-decaprenol L-rhamnosyltransferase
VPSSCLASEPEGSYLSEIMNTPVCEFEARVAVIILNYRTPELVIDCLETLLPEVDKEDDRVLVVDNASGDGSAETLRRKISDRGWNSTTVIESPHNGGFSAGNNYGINSIKARAYLLLNSDTLIRAGAVETLWQTLCSDPEIGIASPRLEWPDGTPQTSCFRAHTPWSELINASATGPIQKLLQRWDVPIGVQDQGFEPDWTSFACVLVRGEVFDTVGLLDESFFMYYEDADFCRRVTRAGFRIRHDPSAHVVHLRGGTSPVKALTRLRKRRPPYYYASRSQYFRNASGPLGVLMANLMWTLGRGISWLRESCGRKPPHTVERELTDVWRG